MKLHRRFYSDEVINSDYYMKGYRVPHFWNDDVILNTDRVLSDIMRKLDSMSCIENLPSPRPSP